jgi:hypothetical protein
MNAAAAYVVREAGEPPRTFETANATARALLCSGPTAPVTVLLAGRRERQLSLMELDRIRRAIPEARAALAAEAEQRREEQVVLVRSDRAQSPKTAAEAVY